MPEMVNLGTILKLERPLGVLDLETTGLNPKTDRIIQIGLTIHYPNKPPVAWGTLVNPEIPIVNQGHTIVDADVQGKPTWKQIGPALAPRITNIDFLGANAKNFDVPFVQAEMERAGVIWDWKGHIIDILNIFRIKNPHNVMNAFKRYVDAGGFSGAHDAENDVAATEQILFAQLTEHVDIPRTVKELADFCYPRPNNAIDAGGKFIWVDGEAVCNFGGPKGHRGTKLKNIPESYLQWMLRSDFPDDVRAIVMNALNGQFPTQAQ